ncbi:MAG: tyrosine-type recombinase/integrase, partial [Raoultibacter sp.]
LMSLRHSFATASMRAGIEVSSVAKWLGHRDVSTTYNRYVRPMLANLHDDAGKINEAFLAAK